VGDDQNDDGELPLCQPCGGDPANGTAAGRGAQVEKTPPSRRHCPRSNLAEQPSATIMRGEIRYGVEVEQNLSHCAGHKEFALDRDGGAAM
jgi:hypothetical protein